MFIKLGVEYTQFYTYTLNNFYNQFKSKPFKKNVLSSLFFKCVDKW